MTSEKNIPVVAIIGKQNVGKSTLFNRIIGRRKAIVHSLPGVTRDRLYADIQWSGCWFRVVDTGGIGTETTTDQIYKAVEKQTDFAIKEADLIVFLCDGQQGFTVVDEKILDNLRKTGKKILLVVNKIDTLEKETLLSDFYKFGIDVFPVSATHGLGTGELLDKIVSFNRYIKSKEQRNIIHIAIVGTPNVGKSSFVNALLNEERVLVHHTPGTTRDSVDINFEYKDKQIVLVDTAGIRKISRLKESADLFSIIRTKDNIKKAGAVILILDALRGLASEELHIINLVCEQYKPLVICVNKWDIIKDIKKSEYENSIRKKAPFIDFIPVLFISAKQRWNIDSAIDKILHAYDSLFLRLDQEKLRRTLKVIVSRRPPPVVNTQRIFIKDVRQVDIGKPGIKIKLDMDTRVKIPSNYLQYLKRYFQKLVREKGVAVRII